MPGKTACDINSNITSAAECGDLCIVKVKGNKRSKAFLAQVQEIMEDNQLFKIKFLNRHPLDNKAYVFPDKEDVSWITLDDAVRKVEEVPIKTRGRLQFVSELEVD